MPVALAPFPLYMADDNNGLPLAFGLVDTFAAGTFTPLATYADPAGATPNTNPVVLDGSGKASIYFTTGVAYKIRQRDSTGLTTLWTVDNFLVSPQGDPTLINDFSATVAQSNQTLDPGEAGTEVLATSMAQEIEELRFVIQEMKGTGAWRYSYTTRHTTPAITAQAADNAMWTPTGTTTLNFRGFIPDGWSTNSVISLFVGLRVNTAFSGAVVMYWTATRYRNNALPFGSGNTSISFAPADQNTHFIEIDIPVGTAYAPGDTFVVSITRLGDDPGDTFAGIVLSDSGWFQYIGIASR